MKITATTAILLLLLKPQPNNHLFAAEQLDSGLFDWAGNTAILDRYAGDS